MNGNLRRALHKIHQHNTDVWCGCVTPSEVLELVRNGAQSNQPGYVKSALLCVKAGDSGSGWFYFRLSGELKRLIGELNREQARDSDH